MDALGMQPVAITPQIQPAPVVKNSAQTTAQPTVPPVGDANAGDAAQAGFDPQVAEQRREEAVQRMAQEIANVFVVSDKTFSIFKDGGGQYITRFTSLRDGRVTYIPEPELFKLAGSAGSPAPLVTIKA